MAGDWIKAHRSMMDSAIWADDWLVKLWLWCLFKANYQDRQWGGITVRRGQFVTGRATAAESLGVSPSKWYRGMERLKELGNIQIDANSKWTIVTICNYATYQDTDTTERTANEQQMNSQRTANEQPADTTKECKKERREESSTSTHAEPAPILKTWRIPDKCPEAVADAINRWQAYLIAKDGRPQDDISLEQTYANKRSAGWSDEKIIRSILKSIEWRAKSWRDPDHDHDQRGARNGKPKVDLSQVQW